MKWSELVENIEQCPDSESTSKLYHKHRDDLLSVFFASQSKSEIEEHFYILRKCYRCLWLFIQHEHWDGSIVIYLPIPDLNDLIDTFIDHLSRIQSMSEKSFDDEYCMICMEYSFLNKYDTFLPKIIETFNRIFERILKIEPSKGESEEDEKERKGETKSRQQDCYVFDSNSSPWFCCEYSDQTILICMLNTLRNISNSFSFQVKHTLISLFREYMPFWCRILACQIKGMKMVKSSFLSACCVILSRVTWSNEDNLPNKSLCSEAWPLFHPVLDIVKREFVGDKIVEDDHEYVIQFFSNLCCDPLHVLEVHENVEDLLDEWYLTIDTIKKRRKRKNRVQRTVLSRIIKNWCQFISILSSNESIIPLLSPKYDAMIGSLFCQSVPKTPMMIYSYITSSQEEKFYEITSEFSNYTSNVCEYIIKSSILPELFHTIPIITFVPTIEIVSQYFESTSPKNVATVRIIGMKLTIIYAVGAQETKQTFWHSTLSSDEIIAINECDIIKAGEYCYSDFKGVEKRRYGTLGTNDSLLHSQRNRRHITHSPLIQYSPPQYLLVKMSFDEERSLRQSVYDLIECTGGGVETLFEQESFSFEGYDQLYWREGMEDFDEEEEEYEESDNSFLGMFQEEFTC
ncbi:hypothetical protein ADUPG1_006220 [Aduncisulcus paluster]|uniref:Uncharacterized protein n=1 Tax=Aduncisulcus paluster TaxID=2918883 RepID=A0ABQ5KHB8_9EUKA|nr:hypothetical protein ADUPG1_006220 [Aduncisulcus paluster]